MLSPKHKNGSSATGSLTEWPRVLPPLFWNNHLAQEEPPSSERKSFYRQPSGGTTSGQKQPLSTTEFGCQAPKRSPALASQEQELSSVQVLLEAAQALAKFLERRGIALQKDVHLELINLVARNAFRREISPSGEDVASLFAFWVLRMEEVETEQAGEETQAS